MRGLGRLHSLSQRIGEGLPWPVWLKFVALLFTIPIFKASQLCFQFTYCVQERRILITSRKYFILKVNNSRVNRNGLAHVPDGLGHIHH